MPEYPCSPTGGAPNWGVNFDWPFINAVQLQQYNGPGGLVQMGEAYCINGGEIDCNVNQMGPAGQPLLVYTPVDTDDHYVHATWFDEGYGPGVLRKGNQYEVLISTWNSGTQWQFAIRDITSSSGWWYHYVSKTWTTTGGNEPWWGFETNSHGSALATDINHNPYITTMEYKTNNGVWHHDPYTDGVCPGTVGAPFPTYYHCFNSGSYIEEGWTDAH